MTTTEISGIMYELDRIVRILQSTKPNQDQQELILSATGKITALAHGDNNARG